MTNNDTINFNSEKALELKKAHAQAVADAQESFTFEGYILFTPYAGYLLEYLSGTFSELKDTK